MFIRERIYGIHLSRDLLRKRVEGECGLENWEQEEWQKYMEEQEIRKEIQSKTDAFRTELQDFYQGDREAGERLMERTTQPYWQSLQLIRKRLQQRKLTITMEFEQSTVLPGEYEKPKKDGYDYACGRIQPVKIKRTCYRDGKRIARERGREIAVYRLIKADVRGERAICPNCGFEGKLSSYIDGCDACGAKFLVSDFDTKVSGFSLEEDSRQKNIHYFMKAAKIVGILAAVLLVLSVCAGGMMFLLLAMDQNGIRAVAAAVTMMLGWGLAPVLFRSLLFMLLIFLVMLIVMQKYVKPRVQGEQIVKRAFPEFSTEDFIQNLEYQLRNIHLADTSLQVQSFAACDLTEVVKGYNNVVDCSISRILFTEAQEFTGEDVIGAEVKLRLLIDDGRRIRSRYEKVQLKLEGRPEVVRGAKQTLREYKCPNCGGSVDLLNGAVCPFCNTTVDYRDFGWKIDSYTVAEKPKNPFRRILLAALLSYVLVLAGGLFLYFHSEDGKELTGTIRQMNAASRIIHSLYANLIYPDEVATGCEVLERVDKDYYSYRVYSCENKEMLQQYKEALLEKGFRERQDYPGGFSVHQWEFFSYEEEEGLLFLVVRAEEVPEGLAVTVSVLDENGEPLQQ